MADQKSMKSFLGTNPTAVPEKSSAAPANTQSATEAKAVAPPTSQPVADSSPPTVTATPPPTAPPDTAQSPPPETGTPPQTTGPSQAEKAERTHVDAGLTPLQTREIIIELGDLPDYSLPENHDEWCRRFPEKLTETNLEDVIESLLHEGQIEPFQVFRNASGRWEVLIGHRRDAGMFILSKRGVPDFSLKRKVKAIEVIGGTLHDRMVRAVADNQVQQPLDQKERLNTVAWYAKAGVGKERAAASLAISVKSYERDLRVATNPRMLAHVMEDRLNPGDASALVLAGSKNPRMGEFMDYLDGWAARKEAEIQELDRLSRVETGKGLKPADLLVKNHLTAEVFDGWLDALKTGGQFTEKEEINVEATLDKSGRLRVSRLNADTKEMSVMTEAKLGAKFIQLGRRILANADKKRKLAELEAAPGPQAALSQDSSPYANDALAEFGFGDMIPTLEEELRADRPTSDERSPDEDEDESTS